MKLTRNILLALLLGVITGLVFNIAIPEQFETFNTYVFGPLGTIFVKLIKMLVVPIVLVSITLGVAGLGDPKKLTRIGGKSILFFLTTTALAISLAITVALVVKPGNSGNYDTLGASYEAAEAPSIVDTFLNIIPDNVFASATSGNMLQIIFFAVLFGLSIALVGDKAKHVRVLLEECNEILMKFVNMVMYTAPFGAFALVASAIGTLGFQAMKDMLIYMFVIIAVLCLHTIVTYGGALAIFAKRNPIQFFKDFFPTMIVAFSTSSSNATLPVAMKAAQEKLNIPKQISSFVQPLGATINMDGTSIMQGVATIFIANAFGVELTLSQLLVVVLTALIASIGTVGVPGVGLIMLAMVLEQVGLPVEGIALIMGVDRLLDMLRTAVNITGDAVCAAVVAKTEEKHDTNNATTQVA